MSTFPDPIGLRSVQAEFLLPHEIDAALTTRSVVYLPLGSIEFHAAHLPIGLDGLTAHGVCSRAASAGGGIVLPTLYYGVGGGHTAYPWTIMATAASTIAELLEQSFRRLQDFGVQLAVLFTGHFADEQLAMITDIGQRWNTTGNQLRVLSLSINGSDAGIAPDHAGIFETSALYAMWPDRVQLDRLPGLADAPSVDPGGDVMGNQRHDPTHPLHGVFGPDPRLFEPTRAGDLLAELVNWTIAQVGFAWASSPTFPTTHAAAGRS
jgi:creatinine amidohydrolase